MKKYIYLFLTLICFILWSDVFAFSNKFISVTGTVRQPLNLSMEDLSRYQTSQVQLNEVMKDGSYRGAFFYRGVVLKDLLETACVQKEESAFGKAIDLAVMVRGNNGKEVVLSWGEIFYKNSSDIIIATSASPIMPHHSCASCHEESFYKPYMDQFTRDIGFPKLVVGCDKYAERSIENVISIEVIDPRPKMPADRSAKLFSESFVVTGDVKNELNIKDISSFPRKDTRVITVGEGKGFHGIADFSGALFTSIMDKAGIEPGLAKVLLISAPDGYRALFSYGEIYLNRVEDSIILADMENGRPIDEGGKFMLLPSDDLMADRDIKSVERIEVFDLKTKPKVTIIGIGSGDTNLITMEAVSAMARADIFICPPDIEKRFGRYMGGKPILLDLYDILPPVMKKKHPGISGNEFDSIMDTKRTEAAEKIKQEIKKGVNVAVLDYGDPTIWSGTRYIREYIDEDMIEIIPGVSSFNVANASLEKHVGCKGSIILTTSRGILENKPLFEAAAKNGETLSVFMAIKHFHSLIDFFKSCYSTDTPVHIAYRAGYSGSEKVIRTDVEGLQETIEREEEKTLFLLYIGPCLGEAQKPFRTNE